MFSCRFLQKNSIELIFWEALLQLAAARLDEAFWNGNPPSTSAELYVQGALRSSAPEKGATLSCLPTCHGQKKWLGASDFEVRQFSCLFFPLFSFPPCASKRAH